MIGGGISYALPFKVVHLYADASYFHDAVSRKPRLSYSGGLSIVLMKDVFEIYIPVFNSKAINENLKLNGHDQWHERITFQANFKMSNPLYLIDRYQYHLY